MKRAFFLVLVLSLLPLSTWAGVFTPGNVIFADPFEDRIVELKLGESTAEIVQIITWPLGDTSRRRPLGLDISPDGVVWVGITGVPTSATEAVDYPTGRGEVLRIDPDGKQTFYVPIDPAFNKATFLSTFRPNEVFLMSNSIAAAPSICYRVRVDEQKILDVTEFIVSQKVNSFGEALELPDGRILIGASEDDGISIFDKSGGEPVGKFVASGRYRSLTYCKQLNAVLAVGSDQRTLYRFDLQGNLEEQTDAGNYLFTNLWGVAAIPGTTKIIVGSHDGPPETRNFVGIFDAANLADPPQELEIVGDVVFRSLFNIAVYPVPVESVEAWELH